MSRVKVAFFDVDHTLTTSGSMSRLLAYYHAALGHPRREFDDRMCELKAMTAVGCPREAVNRAYYAGLEGLDAEVMAAMAGAWFDAERATGRFYHEPAVAALRRHQERGAHIALVSGSFPAPLRLIAADLGADELLCTEPRVERGRYTGKLDGPPMIGTAKADAALKVLLQRGVPARDSIAYGDDISDLPLLRAAGSGVVVGGDRRLRTLAGAEGWTLLPGTPPAPDLRLPAWSAPARSSPWTARGRTAQPVVTSARYDMSESA
ncbi:HAD-IB family hydrolase [Streptomyces sp. HUAS MG91]|uniref:HAD-IB family hydrolase n=1 Tax=Streptomyces tabacisoli TaxID=3156398 RepID=A0AAU8IKM1_9ACTN